MRDMLFAATWAFAMILLLGAILEVRDEQIARELQEINHKSIHGSR